MIQEILKRLGLIEAKVNNAKPLADVIESYSETLTLDDNDLFLVRKTDGLLKKAKKSLIGGYDINSIIFNNANLPLINEEILVKQNDIWKKTGFNSIPLSTATQNALSQRLFLPEYLIDEPTDLNDIINQGQYRFQEGTNILINGLSPFVNMPSCKLIVDYYSDLTGDEWSHIRQTLWTPDATYIRLYDQDGNSWEAFRNVTPVIVDNLTSTLTDRTLSAKQGKVLKDLVDTKEPANTNIQQHITSTSNPHGVTKAQVGLSNVDNTSDVNKPVSTATQNALNLKLNTSLKGAINGLAELGADGKVPSAQLPELSGGGLSVNQVLRINQIIN